MSFENKGFPNDLNSRYHSMNNERDTQAPKIKNIKTGLKLNPVGLPDYDSFTFVNPSLFEGVKESIRTGDIKGTLPVISQPAFIKTDLPEFTIQARKKNKTMYYILSALILAVALYFIYFYVTKKK